MYPIPITSSSAPESPTSPRWFGSTSTPLFALTPTSSLFSGAAMTPPLSIAGVVMLAHSTFKGYTITKRSRLI
ncbi:hypothetical protein ACSBR2_023813 [Camellia fascicularis]